MPEFPKGDARAKKQRLFRKSRLIVLGAVVLAGVAAGVAHARVFTPAARSLAAAATITAKQHEGQRSDGTYTSGNITQYKEGDFIKFRFTLAGSDTGSGDLQVRFTGDDGTCLFFTDSFTLGSIDTTSGATPTVTTVGSPTADSFGTSNGEWVQTLHVDFSAAGEAVVNYTLRLSDHAGECNGSSQHSRLSPGEGVSQTGQQNVPVPANQVIEIPSITVNKLVDRGSGFVAATVGEYCFTLDGATTSCTNSSGQVVFDQVTPDGAHTITESQNTGFTFDSGIAVANCAFSGSTATATVAQGTTATNATCTFKNKLLPAPTVTVTKSCTNGAPAASTDRFEVLVNGNAVNPQTILACGASAQVTVAANANYSITEQAGNGTTDLANYDVTYGSGCSNSSGGLPNGGSGSCTITNALKAAPKLTVTKDCPNGAAASGDRFQVKLNGTNVTNGALACDGHVDVTLSAGQAYAITEAAAGTTDLANYQTPQFSANCSGTLAHFGDTASCTITNTLKAAPKITVTKACTAKANPGDRFQVKLNGNDVADASLDCGGSKDVTVTAGQPYAITEGAAGTTDLANYQAPQFSTDCSGTIAHFGDTKSCTITNTLKAAPKVTVTKSCTAKANAGDLFQVKLNGNDVADAALDCGDHKDVTVTAGQAYTITEGAAGTTDLANYETPQFSTDCSGTLAHFGDTASCTITNTLKAAPKVTVTKQCPGGPAHEGDRFQVKLNGDNVAEAALACDGTKDVTVTAGQQYTITEDAAGTTDLSDYDVTRSDDCTGTIAHFGDTKSCTLTNTLKNAPVVTVNKECTNDAPANASDRFEVLVNGKSTGEDPTILACGGSAQLVLPAHEAFDISEQAGNETTSLDNYNSSFSSECSNTQGLPRGSTDTTCTITNELKPKPKVTVTKSCETKAGEGDLFQAQLDGEDAGAALDCGDSVDVNVGPGQQYDITEAAAGTTDLANYDTTYGEGCSGTLAHFGDTAECTITNDLKAAPTLKVIKTVVNDNGGQALASNFSLHVTGSSPSPADFNGDADGTIVTLMPGAYSVSETPSAGYATTMSAGCSGTIAHFGDTATCTVTNNDMVPPPPPPPPPPPRTPKINLGITKSDSPDPVAVGDNLTYTLTVGNKGPDAATNVVVTDSLPSEVTFVSVSTNKGSCTGTNAISCSLGTVAVGENITITIVVKPTQQGTITNTAVVAGLQSEVDAADNTASATTTVNGPFVPPSVCYTLTVRPRSLTVGHRTILRITVREVRKPVAGVRVVIRGRGIVRAARTNKLGVARFVLKAGSPGILQVRVPTHKTCRNQRIGVIGAFTPPVTG